jgi:hypothetical protein
MFHVYCGKCLSRKAVHNLVEKFSQGRSKFADDTRPGAEEDEITSKDFYAAGFDALVKRWDKCIMLVEDMSTNKSISHVRISHVLRFISICDLFTSACVTKTSLHIFRTQFLSESSHISIPE